MPRLYFEDDGDDRNRPATAATVKDALQMEGEEAEGDGDGEGEGEGSEELTVDQQEKRCALGEQLLRWGRRGRAGGGATR
jgi:hypothetical protein